MKAKQRTLLVLAALILLAAAALAAVTAANRHAEAASSEAAAGDIPLAAFAQAELTQIAYTWQGETLTLDYDGSRWTLAEDPDYHLDQTKCNTMAAAMTGLSAKRRLEPQPGEDYGLDEPSLTVSVTAVGRTETYTFGTTNPVTGDIYLQREGDSALYTTDPAKAECFAYDKEGLFGPFQPADITASSLEAIVYTRADGTDRFTVSLKALSVEGEDGGYSTQWRLEQQPDTPLDQEAVQQLLSVLGGYAAGQVTGADAAALGLGEPSVTVTVTDDTGSRTLTYAAGTDGCYLTVEGDSSAYRVDADALSAFCPAEELM